VLAVIPITYFLRKGLEAKVLIGGLTTITTGMTGLLHLHVLRSSRRHRTHLVARWYRRWLSLRRIHNVALDALSQLCGSIGFDVGYEIWRWFGAIHIPLSIGYRGEDVVAVIDF